MRRQEKRVAAGTAMKESAAKQVPEAIGDPEPAGTTTTTRRRKRLEPLERKAHRVEARVEVKECHEDEPIVVEHKETTHPDFEGAEHEWEMVSACPPRTAQGSTEAEKERKARRSPLPGASDDDDEATDDCEEECVICMEGKKTHVLVPCGHRCVCQACADKLMMSSTTRAEAKCPTCRVRLTQAIKVFL